MNGTRILLTLALAILVTGCASLERKSSAPEQRYMQAQIPDWPNVRYLISTKAGVTAMVNDLKADQKRLGTEPGSGKYLSLSGGGDDGAFGAGLLVGWSQRGDRPKFDLVTGVSTGALLAPFAYLGKDYDPVLTYVYTQTSPDQIYKMRWLLSVFTSDGVADTTPLLDLIAKYVDADFLRKVAYEHQANGRWLLIGTTNIDAGIPVVWNMGKIASIGTPEALDLFRKIMLASASIPGAFPPVMFDVAVDGETYHEMHVDGGVSAQVFLYPTAAAKSADSAGIVRSKKRDAYIIRNSRLDQDKEDVERNTISVVKRSISQLIQAQGLGDIYQIYQTTQKDRVGFNLAFIGPDFKATRKVEFDPEYMKALYQYAYNRAIKGYPWAKNPPGLERAFDEDVKAKPVRVTLQQ